MKRSWKLGPLPASVLLGIPALVLGFLGAGIFWMQAAHGRLFARVVAWSDGNSPGELDPFVIQTFFRFYTVLAVLTFAFLALALVVCDRRTRGGYLAFAIPATVMCLSLVLFLTVPASWLLNYIWRMGWTVARIKGLAYVSVNCAATVFVMYWWVWRERGKLRGR